MSIIGDEKECTQTRNTDVTGDEKEKRGIKDIDTIICNQGKESPAKKDGSEQCFWLCARKVLRTTNVAL